MSICKTHNWDDSGGVLCPSCAATTAWNAANASRAARYASSQAILSPPNKASKNDSAKPDLSLLPKVFLEEVAKAFMVGEKKYGRYNYCKGHNASQLIAAAQRHLTAWFEGEEHDPIDGQHHLGSVGACVAMLLRQKELGTMKDDRFKNEHDNK
jgi:hypothetical protein